MSKLRLRVDKYLEADGPGAPAPEAIASIFALGPKKRRSSSSDTRRELIPITHRADLGRTLDVPPGRYRVEVILPSGELLADDVRVAADQHADVVLRGASSPREWLGWQFLVGNVAGPSTAALWVPLGGRASKAFGKKSPPRGKASKASAKKKEARGRGAGWGWGGPGGWGGSAGGRTRRARAAATRPRPAPTSQTALQVKKPIFWLSSPTADLASERWLQLGRLTTQTRLLKKLNAGKPPTSIAPVFSDSQRAAFRVLHGMGDTRSAFGLRSKLSRDFVAVRSGDAIELLSLPTPWVVPGTNREAVIEIVVQQMPRQHDFCSSIAVHDEHVGLLLGYLSAGSISNASELVERATDLLFAKVQNPLAAAAGAYALIGAETDTKTKDWHEWVQNLMNWYGHVPDGAIQVATLMLRRGPSQARNACALFKKSCERGLPYFSLGLRWLLDGLERFAPSDPEAAELASRVRTLASRMHQQSPFTILRLG